MTTTPESDDIVGDGRREIDVDNNISDEIVGDSKEESCSINTIIY